MRVVLDEGVPRQLVDALRLTGLDADRFRPDWRQTSDGALPPIPPFALRP